jgi:DNA-binding CsgD family transcriptional regulator
VVAQKQAASEYAYGTDGLALCGGLGDRAVIAECLEWFGSLALEAGNYQRGGRLFGAARAFREKIGTPPEVQMSDHYEKLLNIASTVVGEKMLARYLAEGQNMKLDDAIDLALSEGSETAAGKAPVPAPAESEAKNPEDLTPREVEVLRLIAGGMTDAQIANSLTLSSRTVQAHVRSIYAKLGVGNRSAATRWAIDHGLA